MNKMFGIKYRRFKKEIETRAEKLARDAGIDYESWMSYILRKNNYPNLPRIPINGNQRITPVHLRKTVLSLLEWHPLMAAYMISRYADQPKREGLEKDLLIAFERIPYLEEGLDIRKRAVQTLANAIFMRRNLGEAHKMYDEIGEPRVEEINLEIIKALLDFGYVSKEQVSKKRILKDHGLKSEVKSGMIGINSSVAEWIEDPDLASKLIGMLRVK